MFAAENCSHHLYPDPDLMKILNSNDGISRTELAEEVCDRFGFTNPQGANQRVGCLKALRELNSAAKIVLPPSHRKSITRIPRRFPEPLPELKNVPDTVKKISELTLLLVENGLDNENWVENKFGGAPLGDKRLSNRLVEIAKNMGENPDSSYSDAVGGVWSKVKAYYRFIDKPDDSAITMENILLPHRQRTIQRMKAQKTVLCIQDGSDLNFSNLDKCIDIGVIGTNQTNVKSRGLDLHSTIAVTTEGLQLGILHAKCHSEMGKILRKPKNNVRK